MPNGAPDRSCWITVSANLCASLRCDGSSAATKISASRYCGLPWSSWNSFSCSPISPGVMRPRSLISWRSTRVQPSWVRIWAISVERETPWPDSLSCSPPGGRWLRLSMSAMAFATSASGTAILRCWISCICSRSSINWRVICGRSSFSVSGAIGWPVVSANSRARLRSNSA